MRILSTILIAIALLLGPGAPATAQQLANDGFHRRNGQMHVLRNGQLRPMTRDSRLPTGTVVTKTDSWWLPTAPAPNYLKAKPAT